MVNMVEVQSVSPLNEYEALVRGAVTKIKELYLADPIPWVIGYSGGKDSTATLQLVWEALQELKAEGQATKHVNVISTDTLVENPLVAMWVAKSLKNINLAAEAEDLPLSAHKLVPELTDRFWANLIGRGYPAPRNKFRWCTSRLKINASNNFIEAISSQYGEAIILLGTRKSESQTRKARMEAHEKSELNTRAQVGLKESDTSQRIWSFEPISEWDTDTVWMYLTKRRNPWGVSNKELMSLYRGATEGGECPVVLDKDTPSCGDSRFGCYVCTLVSEDKSMNAMIANDSEKDWMYPLVDLRNELEVNGTTQEEKVAKLRRDKGNRDFRRMNGRLTVHISRHGADLVPGPYTQQFREYLLKKLLTAQEYIRANGPEEVRNIELIDIDELEFIRRVWINDKHEVEDNLPKIYEEATGRKYPGASIRRHPLLSDSNLTALRGYTDSLGNGDGERVYEMIRSLWHIEVQHQKNVKRVNLKKELRKTVEQNRFANFDDAKKFALDAERHKRKLELDNNKSLSDEEVEKLRTEIDILTRSRKQPGYSSLILAVEAD